MIFQIEVSFLLITFPLVVVSREPASQSALREAEDSASESLDELFFTENSVAQKNDENQARPVQSTDEDSKEAGVSLNELKSSSRNLLAASNKSVDLAMPANHEYVGDTFNGTRLANSTTTPEKIMGQAQVELSAALDEAEAVGKAHLIAKKEDPPLPKAGIELRREEEVAPLRQAQADLMELAKKMQTLLDEAHQSGTDAQLAAQRYAKAHEAPFKLKNKIQEQIRQYQEKVAVYHEQTKTRIIGEGEWLKQLDAASALPEIEEVTDEEGLPPDQSNGKDSALQKAGYAPHDLEDLEDVLAEEKRKGEEEDRRKLLKDDPLEQLLSEPTKSIRDYSHSMAFGTTLIQLNSSTNESHIKDVGDGKHPGEEPLSRADQELDEFSLGKPTKKSSLGFMAQDKKERQAKTGEARPAQKQEPTSIRAIQKKADAKPHSMAEEKEIFRNTQSLKPDQVYFVETVKLLEGPLEEMRAKTLTAIGGMAAGSKQALGDAKKFGSAAKTIVTHQKSMQREVSNIKKQLKDVTQQTGGVILQATDNSAFEREVKKNTGGEENNDDKGEENNEDKGEDKADSLAQTGPGTAQRDDPLTSMDWKAMEQMSNKSDWEKEQYQRWTQAALHNVTSLREMR